MGVEGGWAPWARGHGPPACPHQPRPGLPTDPAAVKLENFPIHAITGVLKQWLRELPEPLMTFAQYGDFLRAVGESRQQRGCAGGQGRGSNHRCSLWPVGEAQVPSLGQGQDPCGALHLVTHPAQPPLSGRLPGTLGTCQGQAHRELTRWALLELPEKQEQLAAIYAVLEHLPEANHNSLERLIFHLVKQVPAACSPWGGGPHQEPRCSVPWVPRVGGPPDSSVVPLVPPLPAPGCGATTPGLRPRSRSFLATPNCRSPRRVALLEDVNRMSPSALAIIFAPCLLRCPDNSDPLTSMKDVLKVTT